MDGLLKAAAPPREIRADGPDAARVERALTDRLMSSGHSLRLLALALWPIFGLAYQGNAPWWTLACPFALHLLSITGFLWLARAYRREPELRATETWRRLYILYASLTGLAYGIGGALLLLQPYGEPRLLVAAALALAATMAPGRFYEPRSYIVFVAGNLGPLAIGALMSGDPLALAMAVGALLFLVALLMQNAVQYRNQRDQVALSLAHQELARRHAEAEASARAAHSYLHDAMESLPIAISLWDSDDRLVMCNQTYASHLQHLPEATTPGVRFEDAVYAATYKLPMPLARPAARSISSRRRPTCTAATAASRNIASVPTAGCAASRAAPSRAASSPAWSTSPRSSGARREAMQARAVLQSVFDNMSDGVLLYEADGRWVYQNPAMAKLHDMSDELLDTLPTFADIVRYRAQRGDYGPLDELPGGLDGWIESRVRRFHLADQPPERRRTTTGRTVEVTYRRLADRRVLTIHRDLTDIVEQEERLKAARIEFGEDARDPAERARQHDRRRDAVRSRTSAAASSTGRSTTSCSSSRRSRRPAPRATTSCATRRGVATSARSTTKTRSRPGSSSAPSSMRQPGGMRYERRSRSGPLHRVQFPPDPRRRHAGDLSRHHELKEQQAEVEQARARAEAAQTLLDDAWAA